MPNDSETKFQATNFRVLTAQGRGAIATIEVIGQGAVELVQQGFVSISGQPITTFEMNSIIYGRWLMNGQPGEDLVVCPIQHEHLEIYCHGGAAAINAVRKTLEAGGANEIQAAIEFTGYQSAIDHALAIAPTRKTALILLAQYEAHRLLRQQLHTLLDNKQATQASDLLQRVLQFSDFGIHLTRPWSVVLCGQPNVGKSSLINAIVGFERTIVNSVAGTTRDAVSHLTSIQGWPVELTDTAGLRNSEDAIERAGMELARNRIAAADLVVAVIDASVRPDDGQSDFLEQLQPGLIVKNKMDLGMKNETSGIAVSALNAEGIGDLIGEIGTKLVPEIPPSLQAVPVSEQSRSQLQEILSLIEQDNFAAAIEAMG